MSTSLLLSNVCFFLIRLKLCILGRNATDIALFYISIYICEIFLIAGNFNLGHLIKVVDIKTL